MAKKTALKKLCIWIVVLMILAMGCVVILDPFYQYHEPWFGQKAVLIDRDNQMPGSVRNFSYDSVIMGSSVMENCDHYYLNQQKQIQSIKLVKASGSVADLMYYLKMARANHALKEVYWCLDLSALKSDTKVTIYNGGNTPWYLHTTSVLDDVTYLCNKEVILERIPYMIACELLEQNTDGKAYYWADGKNFSIDNVRRAYVKPEGVIPQKDYASEMEKVDANLSDMIQEIKDHPETKYTFFFPPISMAWWDCAYVNGELEQNFYALEQALNRLLPLENVEIFYFQLWEDTVCNLDNFMDLVHYTPEVNQEMLEHICRGEDRVTMENKDMIVADLRDLVDKICQERMSDY